MMKGLTKILLARYVTKQVFFGRNLKRTNMNTENLTTYVSIFRRKYNNFFTHSFHQTSHFTPSSLSKSSFGPFFLYPIVYQVSIQLYVPVRHILGMVLQIVHKPSRSRYWDNSNKLGNLGGGGSRKLEEKAESRNSRPLGGFLMSCHT